MKPSQLAVLLATFEIANGSFWVASNRPASISINVGSSSAALELFTRFDTGHRNSLSMAAMA
jgi:hypothetical protein